VCFFFGGGGGLPASAACAPCRWPEPELPHRPRLPLHSGDPLSPPFPSLLPQGIDEVTVIAAPETATLKSFHRPEAAGSVGGALHSSMAVPASELLKYELTMRSRETEGGGTAYYGRFDVTFALKDLAVRGRGGATACCSSRCAVHQRGVK